MDYAPPVVHLSLMWAVWNVWKNLILLQGFKCYAFSWNYLFKDGNWAVIWLWGSSIRSKSSSVQNMSHSSAIWPQKIVNSYCTRIPLLLLSLICFSIIHLDQGPPNPSPGAKLTLQKIFIRPLAGWGLSYSNLLRGDKYSETSVSAGVLFQSAPPPNWSPFKCPYICCSPYVLTTGHAGKIRQMASWCPCVFASDFA